MILDHIVNLHHSQLSITQYAGDFLYELKIAIAMAAELEARAFKPGKRDGRDGTEALLLGIRRHQRLHRRDEMAELAALCEEQYEELSARAKRKRGRPPERTSVAATVLLVEEYKKRQTRAEKRGQQPLSKEKFDAKVSRGDITVNADTLMSAWNELRSSRRERTRKRSNST